jgi:hypothetical protein
LFSDGLELFVRKRLIGNSDQKAADQHASSVNRRGYPLSVLRMAVAEALSSQSRSLPLIPS